MKKTVIKIIKQVILFLSILLFLYSCHDNLENIYFSNYESSKLNIETLNINQIANDIDFKFLNNKYNLKLNSKNDNYSQKKIESLGITVETSRIKKITTKDYTSYTMLIINKNNNPKKVFNLVIEKNKNYHNIYTTRYYINSENSDYSKNSTKKTAYGFVANRAFMPAELPQDSDDYYEFGAGGSGGSCNGDIYTEIIRCSSGGEHRQKYACQHQGGIHGMGNIPPCNNVCSGTRVITIVDFSLCYSLSNHPKGGGETKDTDIDTDTNSLGGGSPATSLTSPITTNLPCLPDENGICDTSIASEIKDLLGNSINKEEFIWLYENSVKAIDLKKYLDENNSTEAKIFAKNAIEALMNDGEVDFENRLVYTPIENQDYTYWMTPPEKEIFNTLNDYQKLQYLKSAQQAKNYTKSFYPDTYKNGNGDAFRHAFWSALCTIRLGEVLTKRLTDAHENHGHSLYQYQIKEKSMDLFNNEVGRRLANGSGKLHELVENSLKKGELRKLSHLDNQRRPTIDSVLTPTN